MWPIIPRIIPREDVSFLDASSRGTRESLCGFYPLPSTVKFSPGISPSRFLGNFCAWKFLGSGKRYFVICDRYRRSAPERFGQESVFFVECRGIATLRSTSEKLMGKVDTSGVTVASRTLRVNARDDSCAHHAHLHLHTRYLHSRAGAVVTRESR